LAATTYTETGSAQHVNHGWADLDGIHEVPAVTALSGLTGMIVVPVGWSGLRPLLVLAAWSDRRPRELTLDASR